MRKWALMVLLLVGCSSMVKRDSSEFVLRTYQEESLPNGLRLIFIEDQSLPRISLDLMVKSGSVSEPVPGLNSMVAHLLDQGTKSKRAPDIADAFAQIGAEYSPMAGQDFTLLSANGLSIYRKDLLQLFNEVIMTPVFDGKELERLRARRLAEIVKAQDHPGGYADQMLDREIFGHHPYSYPVIGNKGGVRKIKRQDLLSFYDKNYRPGNSILAVVGAFDEPFRAEVKKLFGAWPAGATVTPVQPGQPDGPKKLMRLVSKSDLKQTQIRMGHVGIRRTDPDYMPLRMANLILGGSFESRLNQRVRDDLGLTYSIGSSSDGRLDRGSFEISTFSRNEKAAETIRESIAVLKDFVQKGVTEVELNAAKALMIGQFPASIETPDRLAVNLMILRRYGIPDTYLTEFNQNVRRITVAQVNEAIRKHIQPDRMKIVVYADKTLVLTSLKVMGDWSVEELK